MTDDDEQGRQHDAQPGVEAAAVPVGDPWRTVEAVRRRARRRRQLGVGLVAAAVVMVVGMPALALRYGGDAVDRPVAVGSSRSATAKPTSPASTSRATSCAGDVRVRTATSSRTLRRNADVRLTVAVGDVLEIRATGRCADQVRGYARSGVVMGEGRRFTAVRPGATRLVVSHPMCAELPARLYTGCRGGLTLDGTVTVTVLDR